MAVSRETNAVLDTLLDLQSEDRPAVPVEDISRLSGRTVPVCVASLRELAEEGVVQMATFRAGSASRQISGWHADRSRAEAIMRQSRLAAFAPAARLTALAQL
jgi:hypothetical protein